MRDQGLIATIFVYGLSTVSMPVWASVPDYADLSLEQLMAIEVTSAAKRPEAIANTPAAVFVLTNEDIRRMGARSIPEALRMVPGLNVAQITASTWAISARGFNGRFANKLLVLVDGRSVYTPLFSGVYWDRQYSLLEDIDRIEVIRGPGAALWGANAVNGVINIITKSASETQGTLVSGRAGTGDEAAGAVRHGGTLGELGHYRVYGTAFNVGSNSSSDGANGADDWRSGQSGFRMDLTSANGDAWHLQGGTLTSILGDTFTRPSLTSPYSESVVDDAMATSSFVLGSWGRDLGVNERVEVRASVQREEYDDPRTRDDRNTVDLEALHRFAIGGRHQFVWGVGGRYSQDRLGESTVFTYEPDSDDQYLINAFAQDTIALFEGAVELTLGTKIEYNSYTDLELQPNARLLWHVDQRHSVWGAVSRAVRTPSRAERDVEVSSQVVPPSSSPGLPTEVRLLGSRQMVSEELLSLEAGHRWNASDTVSFDTAVFYNFYDRLLSASQGQAYLGTSGGVPHIVLPLHANNDGEADVYGFEIMGNWRPLDRLRIQGWYAYLETDSADNVDPNYQIGLRSLFNVSPTVTFDTTVRHVSEIESADIDGYTEVGIRIAWRPVPNLELALAGQNILHDERREFGNDAFAGTRSTEIERSIYGSAALKF